MAYEISISKRIDNTGRAELSLRLRLGKVDQQASTHLKLCKQQRPQKQTPGFENISPKDRRSATYR